MTSSRVIAALIVGVLIYGLAMGTTYPLLGIVLDASVSPAWNGISAAATGLGLLAGVAVVPVAGRRLGAGRTAVLGVLLMAGSLLALALVHDFWLLFGARLLLGCGANMMFVVAETALNVFADPARRGRVMGVYTAAVALGFVLGPAVVSVAADRPSLLLLVGAAVTAIALLPLGAVRATVGRSVHPAPASRILPSIAGHPFAFGFLLIASAIDALAISLLPVVARGQGFSLEAGALFVTVFHVGLLIGQLVVGVALDRLGRRRTILACCALSLACALGLAAAGRIGFAPAALLLFVWGGANYGLYTAGLALIGDRFAGAALSAATAAFAAVYALASVVSPAVAGTLLGAVGATGLYLGIAAVYLVAAWGGAVRFRPAEPTLRATDPSGCACGAPWLGRRPARR